MATRQLKPIMLRDKRALALAYERAEKENRTCANAAATFIIEASQLQKQHGNDKSKRVG